MPTVSVVVLTMGDRPRQVAAALTSARQQTLNPEIVLVINGGEPDREIADVLVEPGTNLGIPGGRNAGVEHSTGEVICFLDDDAVLSQGVLEAAAEAFEQTDGLGAMGLRIIDETGETARRHVPGLSKNPLRQRAATSFPGGGCLIRREAFIGVGGLCGPFQYGLEETDLAWRLIDAGWDVVYRSDLEMTHPRTLPTRHTEFFERTARNRVWLAHRSLPLPLAAVYVTLWTLVTVARNFRSPAAIAAHGSGTWQGLRKPLGPRRPISWKTVAKMTLRGRPPIV